MNKNLKRTLAVLTVALHVLTFSGPLHAIDVQEGTKMTLNDLPDGSTINVIGADGNVNVAGRAIVEVLNQVIISQGLDINGLVALLAEKGILIDATAQLNINGGLILSTLGINEAAFLAGLNEISAARTSDPAAILNEGKIHLDANSFLVMLASAIKNAGDIAANGGTVIMAAGDKAILNLGGDGLVNVEVTEPITAEVMDFNGNKVRDVISNSGNITGGGFVKLTAKGSENLFDSIINHTGIIEAQTIGEKDGKTCSMAVMRGSCASTGHWMLPAAMQAKKAARSMSSVIRSVFLKKPGSMFPVFPAPAKFLSGVIIKARELPARPISLIWMKAPGSGPMP